MNTVDEGLRARILSSLDGLLHALDLRPCGDDRFQVAGEPGRFDRVFGGQTVAQALVAAESTVDGAMGPSSLHAYFVESGDPGATLDIEVDRVRDGRSLCMRRVTVRQGDRTLLTALASFHDNPTEPDHAFPPTAVPAPDALPLLQDWVEQVPPGSDGHSRSWVDSPPPLDIRIGEPPSFLGLPTGEGPRSHWMKVPRDVGDDALLHAALLAYASDYFLLDMAFRELRLVDGTAPHTGFSLDHTVWFHRPVRFDGWHLHTQELLALTGHRGLTKGAIHDAAGNLVATAAQEVLVRPMRR